MEEILFAGDGCGLAGQIDYPDAPPPAAGYPLLFILHDASYHTRDAYRHFVDIGRECGYAVFSWDKRGTGRSGSCGKGSTTRDALNAYRAALSQVDINRECMAIVAAGTGTLLLGETFQLFARIQRPAGVLLAGNMLDAQAILSIDTRVQIIVGVNDWTPWQKYGKAPVAAHNEHYPHGAAYYVAPFADRALMDTRRDKPTFYGLAGDVIHDWLKSL